MCHSLCLKDPAPSRLALVENPLTVLWDLTYLPTGTKYNEAVNEVHVCARA